MSLPFKIALLICLLGAAWNVVAALLHFVFGVGVLAIDPGIFP